MHILNTMEDYVGNFQNMMFIKFKRELLQVMGAHGINPKDVNYVAIDNTQWMPFSDFNTLETAPITWSWVTKGNLGEWEIPKGFKVVLKDRRWIDYFYCWGDPFYSEFLLHTPPCKPAKRYFVEEKCSRQISFQDFLPRVLIDLHST
jgi:hypothetical protein